MKENPSSPRARLKELLRRVPEGVNSGSYQKSIQFREFAVHAMKVLNSGKTVNDSTYYYLISQYESFNK